MPLIEWDDEYSVHIELIDEQHRGLMDIINSLADNLLSPVTPQYTEETIRQLVAYSIKHFETEQRMFQKYAYPETEEHTTQHGIFTQKVRSLAELYESKESEVVMEAFHFLMNWLIEHILDSDQRFGNWAKERSAFL